MANSLTVDYNGDTIHSASSSGSATLKTSGKYMEDDVELTYNFDEATNVETSKSYSVSGSGSQTISPSSGYDAMAEVALSVPAQTLPTAASSSATSGYTSKATISRSTSDQYINIPTGFNDNGAYYKVNAIPNGSYTVSATKGTVSNNSVSVTPSISINGGYISTQTLDGNNVTVTASELVSGTKSISANGTGIDVTNYASVNVAVPTATIENNKSATLGGGTTVITPSTGYDAMGQVTANVAELKMRPITTGNLVNTQWVIWQNLSLDLESLVGTWHISFTSANTTYDSFVVEDNVQQFNITYVNSTSYIYTYVCTVDKSSESTYWQNEDCRFINITGGSDVTNANLINWFNNYADLCTPGYADFNLTLDIYGKEPVYTIRAQESGYVTSQDYFTWLLPSGSLATPTIQSSSGIVTASIQTAGYITTGSSTQKTLQLTTKSTQTYTPTTTDQTILYGRWLTGTQTIKGDANLVAGNIKKDVSIFGVTGTYEGNNGIGTLLNTTSLGTISTTSTSSTNLSKSVAVSDIYGYDALLMITSVDSITNNRHTSTSAFIWLTASSNQSTQNAAAIATAKFNTKISSAGVTTTYSSTTSYGIYPNSFSIGTSNGKGVATFAMYSRYNSSYTGTINGSYTTRVYGIKVCDLIGG